MSALVDTLISVRALDNAPERSSRRVALIDATPVQHRSSPATCVHREQQEVEGIRLLLRTGLPSPNEWNWRLPYTGAFFTLGRLPSAGRRHWRAELGLAR